MNKKGMRIIFAVLIAVFITGTVLMPAMVTVFAAEQTSSEQQPTPPSEDSPKDGGNEHSGHHM